MIHTMGIGEEQTPVKITNLLTKEIKEYKSIEYAARNVHMYILNNVTVNAVKGAIWAVINGTKKSNIYKNIIKIEKL